MRIEELYDILLQDKPSEILLEKEENIFKMIPELKNCKGFNQNNDWHIYDVYEHILHVVDNTPTNIMLRLAALFHDIGKPNTYTVDENNKGHFYGHWQVSQNIFNKFAINYDIDNSIKIVVSNLICYHDININKLNIEETTKICKLLGSNGIVMLYQLKRADLLSQNKKYHYLLNEYIKEEQKLLNLI